MSTTPLPPYELLAEYRDAEGQLRLEGIRSLSHEEANHVFQAFGVIKDFSTGYSLYELCRRNYDDLNTFHEGMRNITGGRSSDIENIMIDANRRILNYLLSFRAFIDHQETLLKHVRIPTENYYDAFKQRAAFHYDNSFSYRFLWRLRNYVQHCGLPVGGLDLVYTTEANQDSALLYFDRDRLLQYDGWSVVKHELQQQPAKIIVMPHIEELNFSTVDIGLYAASIHLQRLGPDWDMLNNYIIEVQSIFANSTPTLATLKSGSANETTVVSCTPFPVFAMHRMAQASQEIDYIYKLREQQGSTFPHDNTRLP